MAELKQIQAFDYPKLNAAQRYELERVCKNRLNWSDGGNWIGRGKQPNCFSRDAVKNYVSHTYHFRTDAAATKWNLEWERIIRYAGHIATTGLTVAVTLTTGGVGGIVIGTLAAITKDELQAKIQYPRMARGWTYEIGFEHNFKWSPHPWGQREFSQAIVSVCRDFNGQTVSNQRKTTKYKLEDLPEGLGRFLASAPSRSTQSDYV